MSVIAILICASLCVTFCSGQETEKSSTGVASLFSAYRIPDDVSSPYDNARIKVFYPRENDSESQGDLLPVVIFLSGSRVEAIRYQWLAESLVIDAEVAVVLCDVFAIQNGTARPYPGRPVDSLDFQNPEPVLAGMFEELEQINTDGPLAGRLDLDNVILGGHSAGGLFALVYANEEIFPQVKGVVVYGISLLFVPPSPESPSGSVINVNGSSPVLLIGGDRDAIIQLVPSFQGIETNSPTEPLIRTYNEGFHFGRPTCVVELLGFNHYSIVDPVDATTESVDLDFEATVEREIMKDQLSLFFSLFVREHGHDDFEAGEELRKAIDGQNPYVGLGECKP